MGHFTLILAALAMLGAQLDVRRCESSANRKAEAIRGEVTRGKDFRAVTSAGWILRLRPSSEGWSLEVTQEGREEEDLSRLTPPWHFVPNSRKIDGWHFRNADNTGPNEGSVNAPQALRTFIFSPEVGRGLEYRGSDTTPEDVARVESFGRGWLFVDEFQLTTARRGERAAFEWLKFSACLTWPAG